MFGPSVVPGGDGEKAALEKAYKSRTLSPITNAEAPPRPDDSWGLVRPEQESEPNTTPQNESATPQVTESTESPAPTEPDNETTEETRRYPRREHHAPNYFRPTV